MPRLPRIEGSKLVKAMKKDGFFVARIEGSHYIMQKVFESGEKVTVPGQCAGVKSSSSGP